MYTAQMPVSAVHYRSDGKPMATTAVIPAALAHRWRDIQASRCMVSTEMTARGYVRISIVHPAGGEYLSETVDLGSGLRAAIAGLIRRWDETEFRLWLARQLEQAHA